MPHPPTTNKRKPSPLLALPPELLQQVALHLATAPPNLGPPAALLPLLSVCHRLYALLGWGQNWAFWAKVARAKFTSCEEKFVPYEGYPWLGVVPGIGHGHSVTGHAPAIHAAHALRARCTALAVLRGGDPSAPGAARALKTAYGMLIEDDWAGEKLDWTALDAALGRTTTPCSAIESMRGKGKNRRQLAWAGARAFALRYVLERLYEGRYGERDDDDSSDAEHEHAHPAWSVGWPRDTERAAAALWVVWFFEGEDTLRAEPEPLRRHIMDLLLPMVVAPFRYPSALAPPHHYTVPLLPAVYSSAAFDRHRPITVPTHVPYPLYPLGVDRRPAASATAGARGPVPVGDLNRGPGPRPQAHRRRHQAQAPRRTRHPQHRPRARARARLLVASPARVLFFARMQATVRMGVPPHLPRDRAEARARFREEGGIGTPPIGPTQADIHEKNARPFVRFERALPSSGSSTMTTTTLTPTSASAYSSNTHALAVDPELDLDLDTTSSAGRAKGRDARWAPHRGRAGLCRGYGSGSVASIATPSSAPAASSRAGGATTGGGIGARTGAGTGRGGAPPGRIGRVYALGSFAGLWAGTMLMPSEGSYNALVDTPGGALPPGGLARDDMVAAARPVYMRMREHWSFHPHTPAPPPSPDSTTADEGVGTGWLPPGTRIMSVGAGQVEVRVPAAAASLAAASAFGYGDRAGARRGAEETYLYHTAGPGPAEEHPAHMTDRCPGCVGVRERERWARARAAEGGWSPAASFGEGDVGREDGEHGGQEYDGDGLGSSSDASSESESGSESGSSAGQSSSTPLYQERGRDSNYSSSDSSAPWPEWDAPAWAAHRFNEDESWESGCDGVQDVIFEGETDPQHGTAWHHYEYAGRVRPWDGLIGLIMRPRDRTLGLTTFFISGHLVGRDTFEGTWQMAGRDVLAPSWGGSVCLARGEE